MPVYPGAPKSHASVKCWRQEGCCVETPVASLTPVFASAAGCGVVVDVGFGADREDQDALGVALVGLDLVGDGPPAVSVGLMSGFDGRSSRPT